MGGTDSQRNSSQRNNQVFKGSLYLHRTRALIVSLGSCRGKNSKLLILWVSLKLALLRGKQFSRAVSFPYSQLWLKLIGFGTARHSAPRGSSESVTEVHPSLVTFSLVSEEKTRSHETHFSLYIGTATPTLEELILGESSAPTSSA